MTGKQLMLHILVNDLEYTDMDIDSTIKLLYMDETDAAAKYGVGIATIRSWYELGILKGLKLGETVLFYRDQEKPIFN